MQTGDAQRRRRRLTLRGLLAAGAVLTILLSLLTAFNIPGQAIELFTHFRLQYLCISILLAIALVTCRQWRICGALLPIVVLNAALVYPWYVSSAHAVAGHTEIVLLYANVHASNDDYARLFEVVREEDPDMVFLQEVTPAWVDASRALLRDYPHVFTESRTDNFGIALYSRIPLRKAQHIISPPLDYPSILAEIAVGDSSLALFSTHPTNPLGDARFRARNEQLEFVAKRVSAIKGRKVLLGDLNASIWDPRLKQLQYDSGLANARNGFGVLPTWPTFLPIAMIPIDHVLVSDGIGVVDIHTTRGIGSDHLPLVVTLSL